MPVTYEGKFLIFNRRSKRLKFLPIPFDDKTRLNVGQVTKGVVAGKPVEYWLEKIEGQKKTGARA